MAIHRSKRGLDLPVKGAPSLEVDESVRESSRVALVGADYPGLRPTLFVEPGQSVRTGQLLFEDKKIPGVRYTAPGTGRIAAIHRGERRAFVSLVIELDGRDEPVTFENFKGSSPEDLDADAVSALLLESGEWTALRERPFGKIANPAIRPHSIFVTAIDTNPLSAPAETLVTGSDRERGLALGLEALSKLTDGPVFVCTPPSFSLALPAESPFRHESFEGPHPAGTVGYHIHRLDPVNRQKTVWHIGLQDVVAIGRLFDEGTIDPVRNVALAGPVVERPRIVRTRRGASLDELVEGELTTEGGATYRVISGSILSGRRAMGAEEGFLGRYHLQVCVLREERERVFLGWLGPGGDKFSAKPVFLSWLFPGKKFDLSTSTHGSRRAIVPIGSYEKVMPMDILPTFLLRALVMKDVERALELGCLELDEEDLALCTFVDVGKADFGASLREVLAIIEKED